MGRADFWAPGDYNVICDRTGAKMKRSQCRKEWNGLLVRRESFEERHPQDTLRSREDHQAVPDPRSEAAVSFIGTNTALEEFTGIAAVTGVDFLALDGSVPVGHPEQILLRLQPGLDTFGNRLRLD